MGERIHIVETLRDAWQGLPEPVPTADKAAFIQKLVDAGFPCLDIGSFVSRKKVPGMADTDGLLEHVSGGEGTTFMALAANERGLERLLAVPRIAEVLFPFSLSEIFSRRNIGQTRDEALARLVDMAAAGHGAGRRVYVTISMAFGNNEGDPYELGELCDWVARLHEAGADRVGLADTTAVATPQVVGEVFSAVASAGHEVPSAHLHVTPENQGAMIDAALDAGCRAFDAALGALGGCQFAKGAVSNVSTLPLVRQLLDRGLESDVPADALEVLDAEARALAV